MTRVADAWKGQPVAGTMWALAQRYLRARRRRPPPPMLRRPPPKKRTGQGPSAAPSGGKNLGERLVSPPRLLERLVAVRPHTLAVLLTGDQPPQLKLPGEQLRPSLLSPIRPMHVVVVNTAVTNLDLTVDEVVSLDGYPIRGIKVRIAVQLSDHDRYAGLVGLVVQHGADLDSYLLEQVKRGVETKLDVAVRMNRLVELQRQTLQEVLAGGWLPGKFADGVLVQRGFTIRNVTWPDVAAAPPNAADPAAPFSRPNRALSAPAVRGSGLELTMDAGLRRLWSSHADLELLGIAGAKVGDGATVIAVPAREPGAYEGSRLREAFGDYYADRSVRLVSVVAHSYDEVVRAWFRQVDSWPRRLVSVQSVEDDAAIRIRVDQGRLSAEDRAAGISVGRASDREALQRLLPHERVEFVAADTSG